MKLSRNLTLIAHTLLDQILPPFLRDNQYIMFPFFWLLFGKKARFFMDFKENAPGMSRSDFRTVYQEAAPYFIQRETDLNTACMEIIKANIIGNSVLDVACGRGFLARQLSLNYQVTAADIFIEPEHFANYPDILLKEVFLTELPFSDNQFDTVVSTHTLEHVSDLPAAVNELRRVASKRLIIVVPRQRPYRYTFDLHLHFFPYDWSFPVQAGKGGVKQVCRDVRGDWLYVEDY